MRARNARSSRLQPGGDSAGAAVGSYIGTVRATSILRRARSGRLDRAGAAPMLRARAPVAELVDAADSKSVARKGVLVRVRPGAPYGGAARMPLPSRPPAPSATIDSRAAPFARAGRAALGLGSWPT